ncbi:MAG: PIN domain-containing protein [Kineosporiaceae bacterium]
MWRWATAPAPATSTSPWPRSAGFELLDMDQTVWDSAAATQRALAAHGRLRAVGIPDLLIAATAARHRVTVVHHDRDFDHIASVTGQPVQWVVPPGSAD